MPELRKVAHVMRRFVPEKWGGTECVVFNLSRELNRRKIESPVFCTDMFAESGLQTLEEVSIRRFPYVFPWFGLSKDDKQRLRLKGGSPLSLPLLSALRREQDVSLIHTHVQHRLGGMARTVARKQGIPYVVSLHGGHFTLPQEQVDKMTEPFRGKLEWGKAFGALLGSRRVLQDADAIICVGRGECEEVMRRFPGKPVHYIPNGVDVRRFAEADATRFREAYGFQPLEKIVLCVSRIDYQKNQLGLVRAFKRFSESHPDYRLVLIGPVTVEAYRRELDAEIQRLELGGKVVLIDGFRPDDPLLPGAYKAAEVFVLPSMHEPFGIVVLEAWAAGTPVVASRVGGIPGFSNDRKNILHSEPGNERQLAERMLELATDQDLRAALTSAAFHEVSANYDWSEIAAKTIGVYESVMSAL